MNWFEQLTALDPDANTGTFEAIVATVIGIAFIAVASYVVSRRSKTAR